MLPAIRAFSDIRIITVWVLAVIPIIARSLLYDRCWALLYIDRWCNWNFNDCRWISIIIIAAIITTNPVSQT